jgi:hypothetical protein
MSKFSDTTKPKSDQTNSDDLLNGSITIKVRDVVISDSPDQPVSVFYVNDNNKPFKPSKTMRRVMMVIWGDDSDDFIGKSMTIFRDPKIKWAGKECGGISISHMSDMKDGKPQRLMLTSTRGQKSMVLIEPLKIKNTKEIEVEKVAKANVFASQAKTELEEITTIEQLNEWTSKNQASTEAMAKYPSAFKLLNYAVNKAAIRLTKGGE